MFQQVGLILVGFD